MNARAHRNTGISINFIHLVFDVIQAMFFPHRKNFYILLLISVNARAIIEVGFFSPRDQKLAIWLRHRRYDYGTYFYTPLTCVDVFIV